MTFVNKHGEIIPEAGHETFDFSRGFTLVYDTEYTTKSELTVDSVQCFIPEYSKEIGIVYTQLTEDFNPIIAPLIDLGVEIQPMNRDSFEVMMSQIIELFTDLMIDYNPGNPWSMRKAFTKAVNTGYFDDCLNIIGIDRKYLKYKRTKSGRADLYIDFPVIDVDFMAHFAEADLFKVFGWNWQHLILGSLLESRRTIKGTLGITDEYLCAFVNGVPYQFKINLRDTMHRLPPVRKGLKNQCDTFKTEVKKVDIESDEVARSIGLKCAEDVKSNMTTLKEQNEVLFNKYAINDVFATYSLHETQQKFLNQIRGDFNLKGKDVKDTAGSNVSGFLIDLYQAHFKADMTSSRVITEKGKNFTRSQLVTHKRAHGNLNKLAEIESNNFGVQTFRTVGGLLYTRTAKYPHLSGFFGDLDQSSCYATALSELNVYLGSPVTTTFKDKRQRPKLKDVIQTCIDLCTPDSWFMRVSGNFEQANNTLVLSDLRFDRESDTQLKTKWDKEESRKTIAHFNENKVSKSTAESTLLTKEVKFGLINQHIFECLKLLPEAWFDEYMNLEVDAITFIPKSMMCQSLEELEKRYYDYPDTCIREEIDLETLLPVGVGQYSRDNLCLVFPIHQYAKELKEKRSEYKKAKNPIQEVYKLFLNSIYGTFACQYLPINNVIAANTITGRARSLSWLMMNGLNGFQVITDGCTFSWNNIPLGKQFLDVLEECPDYLQSYQPTLSKPLDLENYTQSWMDENFHNHLRKFFNIEKNSLIDKVLDNSGFELKTEKFITQDNKTVEMEYFTGFYNHGSGSYCKEMDGFGIIIQDEGHDFLEAKKSPKARGFKGVRGSFINWYTTCLKEKYELPVIHEENQIIKFSDGTNLVIRYLIENQDVQEIVHPMGFSTKRFKLMKLITRSQFLFQTEKQLLDFQRVIQVHLENMSKQILRGHYTTSGLRKYGGQRPVGIGFEIMTYMKKFDGSIKAVRQRLYEMIESGTDSFLRAINIPRIISKYGHNLKDTFLNLIEKRYESDKELFNTLINSRHQRTLLKINRMNIITIGQLRKREIEKISNIYYKDPNNLSLAPP